MEEPIRVASLLVELGGKLLDLINRAMKEKKVEKQILLYLKVAQDSVKGLGEERQQILTDARRCDVSNDSQVKALWERIDRYLKEDNIRPVLAKAIEGLEGSRKAITSKTKGLRWRKRDKEAALWNFLKTLDDLNFLLNRLANNFLPASPSGMGVQTLIPIEWLVKKIRDKQITDYEAAYEELGDFVNKALSDSSHEDWIKYCGKVERLIAELQLAFSVKDEKADTN